MIKKFLAILICLLAIGMANATQIGGYSGVTRGASDARYLIKSGDTMTGSLEMSSHKVTGLATPDADNDATTKYYVDNFSGGGGGKVGTKVVDETAIGDG